jgi:hypothetical protein
MRCKHVRHRLRTRASEWKPRRVGLAQQANIDVEDSVVSKSECSSLARDLHPISWIHTLRSIVLSASPSIVGARETVYDYTYREVMMRRRQSLTILSALVCTMLALIPGKEAAAVSASACIICEEECQNLLLLCELRNCSSSEMSASCHPPNADCVWDWDDNDDAILCDYNVE